MRRSLWNRVRLPLPLLESTCQRRHVLNPPAATAQFAPVQASCTARLHELRPESAVRRGPRPPPTPYPPTSAYPTSPRQPSRRRRGFGSTTLTSAGHQQRRTTPLQRPMRRSCPDGGVSFCFLERGYIWTTTHTAHLAALHPTSTPPARPCSHRNLAHIRKPGVHHHPVGARPDISFPPSGSFSSAAFGSLWVPLRPRPRRRSPLSLPPNRPPAQPSLPA